jgi:hypothetical protein
MVTLSFYLYGDEAAGTVTRETPLWQTWIQERFPMPSETSKSEWSRGHAELIERAAHKAGTNLGSRITAMQETPSIAFPAIPSSSATPFSSLDGSRIEPFCDGPAPGLNRLREVTGAWVILKGPPPEI